MLAPKTFPAEIVACLWSVFRSGSTVILLGLGRFFFFFNFLILYTVAMSAWTGNQPVARPTPTQGTNTSMPRVGFEPTIPAFERAKTVHALDRAATVIGTSLFYIPYNDHRNQNL
jgi:Na+-transporting methylmalonyl-CoA/oxaloacetate decarboxylase gamma subunit